MGECISRDRGADWDEGGGRGRRGRSIGSSVAGSLSQHFFDKLNKIAKNLKIFMEIDLIKYYHLIFFS